jgi:penicillin amidase
MPASVLRAVALLVLLTTAACRKPPTPEAPPPAAPPLPIVSGVVNVDGLAGRVTVVRDTWGIPHITAATQDDLFFAQGFVQAQDRLFQMDLWRRSAQGRLSEVLGANFIERDAMTRRMQFRGDMGAEWAAYGPDAKAIATAFTRGINAWIEASRDRLPEEFALAGWEPERWEPEDLLNRTDAFVASGGADEELFRARLSSAVGIGTAARLLGEPAHALSASQSVDLAAINFFVGEMLRRAGTVPFFSGLSGPVPGQVRPEPEATAAPLPLPERPVSGVALAVDGARSATGQPILAGQWLASLERPALRYLVHLTAPGWNVIGATAPWRPGVAIGHNTRVAWSFSPVRLDTQDVFVERLNPANPKQVAVPGGWRDLTVVMESVQVKGRKESFDYEKQYSPHGIVVALDRERHLAYTLRWSGFEPGGAAELGALAIGRAQSGEAFRRTLARWKMPAAEFVYADVDGHVATQAAGLVPQRAAGRGALPSAGWTREAEWRGWLSLDRLPRAAVSQGGLAVVAPASQARRERILELVKGPAVTVGAIRSVLSDTFAWNASQLVPLLTTLRATDPIVEVARQRLLDWDRTMTPQSTGALLYAVWEHALLRRLAALRIPSVLLDEFVPRADAVLVPAIVAPSAVWFDGDPIQARNRLLLDALAAAVDDERRWTSADASAPWGRYHLVTFKHPLAISKRAIRRYNIGPFSVPGYAGTVAASVRTPSDRSIAPVVRVAMDLADWDRSRAVVAPGQSALPDSPHAGDLAQPWLDGTDVPLVFTEGAIAAAAETMLMLVPR